MPADQHLAGEGGHAEPQRHRAVDDDRRSPPVPPAAGRPSGRAPCRASTPGGSAGPRTRRPSRWRRGRPAGWPPRSARLAPKSSQTKSGRQASRTTVMALGTVRTRSSVGADVESSSGRRGRPRARFYDRAALCPEPWCRPRIVPQVRRVCQSGSPCPASPPSRACATTPGVIRLDQVIAPPYDVIEPADAHAAGHPPLSNSVHVELPEADLRAGLDRYQVAARLLAAWRADGVLLPEDRPAFYPYRMTDPDGRPDPGVIGALGLPEEGEEGDVLPHEETLPKPRSDRLDLLHGDRRQPLPHLGPLAAPGLSAALAPEGPPEIDVHDDDGVRHQLWVLDDRLDRRDRGGRRRHPGGDRRRPPPLRDRPHVPARRASRARRRPRRTTTRSWRSSSSCPRTSSSSRPIHRADQRPARGPTSSRRSREWFDIVPRRRRLGPRGGGARRGLRRSRS